MRKTLTAIGNSLGLVIDRPILEALGITRHTVLELEIRDGDIVVRADRPRTAASTDELHEWARSLLVRLEQESEDEIPPRLEEELSRFHEVHRRLRGKAPARPRTATLAAARDWVTRVIENDLKETPPPLKPIITREIALAILEELADARGSYREVTAGRPYAGASSDLIANVLWFLIARGHVELHPDSRRLRPIVERQRSQGRLDDSMPDSVAEALIDGVTLLRLTAAGGDHLHELRRSLG